MKRTWLMCGHNICRLIQRIHLFQMASRPNGSHPSIFIIPHPKKMHDSASVKLKHDSCLYLHIQAWYVHLLTDYLVFKLYLYACSYRRQCQSTDGRPWSEIFPCHDLQMHISPNASRFLLRG